MDYILSLRVDETKLTKQDKEEILAEARELMLLLLEEVKEKIDELAEMVKKCWVV